MNRVRWPSEGRRSRRQRGGLVVPAFNLLQPALPARRARVVAIAVALLVLVSLVDLAMVLAWTGITLHNDGTERQILALQDDEARWRAEAARYAPSIQERAELTARLEILQSLPPGYVASDALLRHLSATLPPGSSLTSANLAEEGRVVLSGVAPSYQAVEQYARSLQRGGFFAYVRVATAAETGSEAVAGEAGSSLGSGPVSFQFEGWLKEMFGHDGGV
ncbi:fimbrial assembly protein [Thermaerobacter sp. PB12/4term]|uniref:PilN domain-containing protein n=1 Tax=Thermaerobacter sp. PB12/4term TaxID=2293838 RepID=UPI000E32BFA1|nr:PilN domain-containing protein [Thermaerobacter sp. PB12/4term]QIA26667.1 fimbrial assembly protein [Thermaerobacter sp. PB12/4term]